VRRLTTACCLGVAALLASGCGGGAKQAPPPDQVQVISPANEAHPAAGTPAAGGPVQVSAEGTRFDPPVQVLQLPDGVWYCDMGTVHFARTEEGDGTCPRCGMKLKHKVAAAPTVQ